MELETEFTDEQRRSGHALIDALRSGEFQQGIGFLRRELPEGGIGYCCLGVACELHRRENPDLFGWSDDVNAEGVYKLDFGPDLGYGFEKALLPSVMLDVLGMNHRGGTFAGLTLMKIDEGTYETLGAANDEGVTFSAIADYLETVYGPRP